MRIKRIIIISVLFFSITLSAGQNPSRLPPKSPPFKPGMTAEEFLKRRAQIKQQTLERKKKELDLTAREAWKRLLRVTEPQWRFIDPKYEKVDSFCNEMYVCAAGWGDHDEQSFRWHRRSKDKGGKGFNAKTPEEMTEGEKLIEDLIDLLEDEKSTDEAIGQKLDALQKVADDAKKQLPKARRELEKVLTNPRQEAVFLLTGYIK